jgi:hypothetical protein
MATDNDTATDADPNIKVTAVVDNELSQLDSSVYTQIFIPSDGELNPSAFKYRDQVSTTTPPRPVVPTAPLLHLT